MLVATDLSTLVLSCRCQSRVQTTFIAMPLLQFRHTVLEIMDFTNMC